MCKHEGLFGFAVQVARRVAARTAERKRQEAEAAAAAAAIAAQRAAEEAEVEEAARQERASFTAIKARHKLSQGSYVWQHYNLVS